MYIASRSSSAGATPQVCGTVVHTAGANRRETPKWMWASVLQVQRYRPVMRDNYLLNQMR